MAAPNKSSSKDKAKDKGKVKPPKPEAKVKKVKKAKEQAAEATPAPVAAPVAEAPRPPADPRMKVVKKFAKRLLPKGSLRDRKKEILNRWNSGDDRGGVTLEEVKSLLGDWRASQQKQPRKKKQTV